MLLAGIREMEGGRESEASIVVVTVMLVERECVRNEVIFMSNCSMLETYEEFDVSHPFANEPTANNVQGLICKMCCICR